MKNTFIVAAGALFLVSCSPTEYQVKREMVIDAPASVIFDQVNIHANRTGWSPWEEKDPNLTKSYEGAESGVGSIYKWSGNEDVGTGMLEITESNPASYIKSELNFTAPWESSSTVEWNFEEVDGGTKAVWTISGELPGYMFWMGQDDMDEAMGADLDKGLENLKSVSESSDADATPAAAELSAEYVEVESSAYYFIEEEAPFSEVNSDFFGSKYGAIMEHLGDDSENMTSPPFAIFSVWDQENEMAKIAVSIACTSEKPETDLIKKGMTYAGHALKCVFVGNYNDTEAAHNFIYNYVEENNYQMNGSPWEVYVTDPSNEPDPSKYITEIYYPVLTMVEEM